MSYSFAFSYYSWGSQGKNTEVVCHFLLQVGQGSFLGSTWSTNVQWNFYFRSQYNQGLSLWNATFPQITDFYVCRENDLGVTDRMWSTGEGNGKPLQYSCLENLMNSIKRQKYRTLKDKLSRLVGAQYATGDQWRNNSRKNEETEPKWKQCPGVDVTGDGSKVWCCKEQYCIGTWKVRSMNQGKLEVEMARAEHQHFRNQWN